VRLCCDSQYGRFGSNSTFQASARDVRYASKRVVPYKDEEFSAANVKDDLLEVFIEGRQKDIWCEPGSPF
jgi:hypothetical protein